MSCRIFLHSKRRLTGEESVPGRMHCDSSDIFHGIARLRLTSEKLLVKIPLELIRIASSSSTVERKLKSLYGGLSSPPTRVMDDAMRCTVWKVPWGYAIMVRGSTK
ncbi:predicted protein [Sclerotinia sclerotiorum 1980 UF-70]|uniref:Uncharacterized protein n=1 Tax=Sclerotinia sclerotiorum (strain ATCC 18683 / 1980 / Ss-1) TaxID=665079 RepID=A7ECR3_SCLS1|nr:predicted protein [Sclerotinia sclerotiorum 1980 UF-70]EDO00242.1 predicted protein [Sclerotinia sclerotiorum 1980 UF-70]